jgi:hypothetical protein
MGVLIFFHLVFFWSSFSVVLFIILFKRCCIFMFLLQGLAVPLLEQELSLSMAPSDRVVEGVLLEIIIAGTKVVTYGFLLFL